ncbi:MAG TPA: hypothetical protein VFK41_00135 [Nocardioidaceae bacterium]|nr:hypothetical protein [Nocardioidaceae bacterium]
MKSPPERPAVIVPRHRRVPPHLKRAIDVRYRSLEDHEHDGMATSKARTVIDCAKDLPFDRALAVADSALRSGDVTQDELLRLAAALPSNGRKQALRVAAEADGRADNPFESCLRAIALDVPGLRVEAQVDISEFGFECRPDLVDVERRIVIEADSFEFHSTRRSLRKDIERYTDLVALVEGPQTLATSPRTTRKSA